MSGDEQPVPRIPRAAGRGFRPSASQLLKIAITAGVLVMIVIVQKPCADSVSGFVTSFDKVGSQGSGSAANSAIPKPGEIDPTPPPPPAGEVLSTDMTEEQTRAAIERVRARAEAERAQRAGSGSGGSSATPRSP